jgi:hypothetical protein
MTHKAQPYTNVNLKATYCITASIWISILVQLNAFTRTAVISYSPSYADRHLVLFLLPLSRKLFENKGVLNSYFRRMFGNESWLIYRQVSEETEEDSRQIGHS